MPHREALANSALDKLAAQWAVAPSDNDVKLQKLEIEVAALRAGASGIAASVVADLGEKGKRLHKLRSYHPELPSNL